MDNRLGFLSATGILVAAVTVIGIGAWIWIGGAAPFSPGTLNAVAKGQTLGGVSDHAQLGNNCGACHTAPWSSKTMADRCVACHGDVSTEIVNHVGIHGGLMGALSRPTCGGCHSEHRGPTGSLNANFDHNKLAFKLTGKHASLPCQACHTQASSVQDLRNTPRDCYSCHAKNDTHNGAFGRQCGQCHSTDSWANAKFNHTIFPVNHGSSERVPTCRTCHPTDVSAYTCFGCHAHTPARVVSQHEGQSAAQLANCVRCHAGGRRGD